MGPEPTSETTRLHYPFFTAKKQRAIHIHGIENFEI